MFNINLRRFSLVAASAVLSSLVLMTPARAAIYTVDSNADASDANTTDGVCQTSTNVCTLRAAIEQANASAGTPDQITIPLMTITLTGGQLSITDSVSISGAGQANTVIDGNGDSRVFNLTSGTNTLSNLKVTGGEPASGDGGGINVSGGTLTLDTVTVTGNTAGSGSGGGGIVTHVDLTVSNSDVTSNSAAGGGGITVFGGDLNVNNESLISQNVATGFMGGGISLSNGTATIEDSIISLNSAPGASGWGGGISSSSSNGPPALSITNTEFSGNSANVAGGAINLSNGTASITSSQFLNNNGGQAGAINATGFSFTSELTMDRVDFFNNQGTGTAGYGGALLMDEGSGGNVTVSVERSAFLENDGYNGGAIQDWNGDLDITNSTFSGNTAKFNGGAINHNDGTATLLNVTIAGNQANTENDDAGGGGISAGTGLTLENSIVANNTAGSTTPPPNDCKGTITSNGHNIVEEIPDGPPGQECTFTPVAGDQPGVDPELGTVGVHGGGITQTYPLLPTSPALDEGDNTDCPTTDQRGFPRPTDGPDANTTQTCDIGAYEALLATIDEETFTEPTSGSRTETIAVTTTEPVPEQATVDVAISDDTATEGDDYECPVGGCNPSIPISEDSSSGTFDIDILADNLDEGSETFLIEYTSTKLLTVDSADMSIIDPTELPIIKHGRALSLNLRRHLIAEGRLRTPDGFNACRNRRDVALQRFKDGKFRTVETVTTTRKGFYSEGLPDKRGRYRALAKKLQLERPTAIHVCKKTVSAVKRHKH